MKSLKLQYGILLVMHVVVLGLILFDVILLLKNLTEIVIFEVLLLVFVFVFLILMGKQRYTGCIAQLDESLIHLTTKQQYLPLLCMSVVIIALSVITYQITHSINDIVVSELSMVILFSNYDIYTSTYPVLIVRKDACYIGLRWIKFDDMEEIYIEPQRKKNRQLVIYEKGKKRRSVTMLKKDLELLMPYLPAERIKEQY